METLKGCDLTFFRVRSLCDAARHVVADVTPQGPTHSHSFQPAGLNLNAKLPEGSNGTQKKKCDHLNFGKRTQWISALRASDCDKIVYTFS